LREFFCRLLPEPGWFEDLGIRQPGVNPVFDLVNAGDCIGKLHAAVRLDRTLFRRVPLLAEHVVSHFRGEPDLHLHFLVVDNAPTVGQVLIEVEVVDRFD
jgi:hypothetical protein